MINITHPTIAEYLADPNMKDLFDAAASSVHQRFGLDFGIRKPEISGFNPDANEVVIYSSALFIKEKSVIGNSTGRNKHFALAFVSDWELGTWVFCREATADNLQATIDAYQEQFKDGLPKPTQNKETDGNSNE